jgi:hypothetical protein
MAGWSHKKRQAVEAAFYVFLNHCYINSKDSSTPICLGENLLLGQIRFITAVFDGLEQDKHKVYVLKSRQLGISTIARALSVFYLGLHNGMLGALVFDSAENKNSARAELEQMINDLPPPIKFPGIKGGSGNREGLTLLNDARILFKSAGIKKTKTSGTLGRSVGLSFHHSSELCSWDNDAGLKSFEQSLSERNPDRLYIYESTARGFNSWYKMCMAAKEDPDHCVFIFVGWWSHDHQKIDRSDTDFAKYATEPPTQEELAKIKLVKEYYEFDISLEQLAWIRRKMDPTIIPSDEIDPDSEDTELVQEQPWTEDEAFQQTGSVFFSAEKLTDQSNNYVTSKCDKYMFLGGVEFTDMRVNRAEHYSQVELKVWEEPEDHASYVMGIDPAYGENEHNCRSSIEIFKCYADGLDQVAEYAWPLTTTRHLSWIIAALLGWYGGGRNGSGRAEIGYMLELNGPGMSVFDELKSLRRRIEQGYQREKIEEQGLRNVFSNVRTYIYTRPDSMGGGHNYHTKTTTPLKVTYMERFRDFVSNQMVHIRSTNLVQEMTTVARDGDSIGAPASMKDDRVVASAIAVYYWETRLRPMLITQKKTREAEAARKRDSIIDQVTLFNQNTLGNYFKEKQQMRTRAQLAMSRDRWRYGR